MIQLPVTLAAGGIEALIWVAFLFFMFIGWIANLIKGVKAAGQQQGPRPKPRNPADNQRRESIQNEIDKFLKQSRPGETQPAEVPRPVQPEPVRRPPLVEERRRTKKDVWEEQTGRRPPTNKSKRDEQKQKSAGNRRETSPSTPIAPPVPAQEIRRAPFGGSSAFASLAERTPAVGMSTDSPPSRFVSSLGPSTGDAAMLSTTSRRETGASKLLRMFQSQRGIREAILINEVLSPPLSLRKTKGDHSGSNAGA